MSDQEDTQERIFKNIEEEVKKLGYGELVIRIQAHKGRCSGATIIQFKKNL